MNDLLQSFFDEFSKIAAEKDAIFDIKAIADARKPMAAAGQSVRDMARAAMQKTHLQAPTVHSMSPSVSQKLPHLAEPSALAKNLGSMTGVNMAGAQSGIRPIGSQTAGTVVTKAAAASVVSEVRKKYPELTKEKDSNAMGPPTGPQGGMQGGMQGLPGVINNTKIGSVAGAIGHELGPASRIGQHLVNNSHAYDLAGLGVLAGPSLHNLGHAAKTKLQGGKVDKKEVGHSLAEVGGLGILAAPVAAQMFRGH